VRYTPVASHQVASVVIGEQPPAVLLVNPGVISIDGLHEEPHVAAAVDALAGLGGLVSFDRRGIGLSDRDALPATTASRGGRGPGGPPPPGDADNPPGADVVIAAWADDAAAVLHAAGAGPVLVVGNSDSCLVALMLAARHPEAVAGLVLVHPYARYTRAPTYPHGLDPSTAAAMSGDVLTLDERPARFDPLSHIAPSLAADHGFRAWWDALGRRAAGPRAAAALHRAIFESDVRQVVPEVAAPTLLVHRRSCAGYDVGHLRWLAERLPHARVAGLAGADELWFVGDVAALVEAVERFAAQVSLGSR
jgi:pimeloyl-ACP methyl ester carboxylesterase